jgi:hypothetical protein
MARGRIPMRAPTKDELNAAWLDWQNASRVLAEMRDPDSKSSKVDCERQLEKSEKYLQRWIELSQRHTVTLN